MFKGFICIFAHFHICIFQSTTYNKLSHQKVGIEYIACKFTIKVLGMEYRSVKGLSGWGQLGFLFAFLGVGFVLVLGVQLLFTLQMLPADKTLIDADAAMKAMLAPENVGMARALQVLSTFALMFVPAVLWNYFSNGKSFHWLGFSKHINVFQVLLAFMIIYAAAIAASPLEDFTKYVVSYFPSIDAAAKHMEDLYTQQAVALSNLRNIQEYIIALFIMAFFPAMFEEVFFRGTMQNLLVRWLKTPILAIIITSLLFSLIHSSIYLFLSRAVLGFALGLMFYKTKNIWVNIIAHFLNNAFALTALYAMRLKTGKVELDKIDPHVHWSLSIVGMVALVGLFFILTKYSAKNKAKIEADERMLIAASLPKEPITHFQNN
jgi:uncharacterized protein